MNTVLLDFKTRVQEVDGYFIFLETLIKEKTKLAFLNNDGEYVRIQVTEKGIREGYAIS